VRTDDEAAFEAFVAARSDDLMRTAVLLTRAGMTEPASVTAMRQLVADARLRWSGSRRAAVQEAAGAGEHEAEQDLADPDPLLPGAEPGHRRHQQDDGDPEHEQRDQPLASGVTGGRGAALG
jgi:hypothetical protein